MANKPIVPPQTILRQQLADTFSEEEFRSLCFDLQVNYDHLPGEGLAAKARELVMYMQRQRRVDELLAACRRERPHLNWPERIPDGRLAAATPAWWPGEPKQFALAVAALLVVLIIVAIAAWPKGDAAIQPTQLSLATESPTSIPELVTSPTASQTSAPGEEVTNIPAPTDLPVPPDVIITEFEAPAGVTVRVARRLEEDLQEQLEAYNLQGVNIRIVTEPVISREQAAALATESGSKVVVWGWYDDLGINVRIYLTEEASSDRDLLRTRELPLEREGGEDNELALFIGKVLPENVSFLSLFIIGQLRYQANEYQAGYEAFDAAMANLPETAVFENEALLHFFRGRQLDTAESEDIQTIICEYARAIEIDPEFAAAYNNLGVFLARHSLQDVYEDVTPCLMAAGLSTNIEPIELLGRAAELQPTSAIMAYNYLVLQFGYGFFSISMEQVDELIARDPSIPGPYILSGVIAVQQNDFAKAEARFQAAIDRLPGVPEVQLNLGLVYLLQDQPEEARAIFEGILAQDTDNSEALLALAYLAYQEEGAAAAQVYLDQISPLDQLYPPPADTGDEDAAFQRLPDGFNADGYATAAPFMAGVFRSHLYFEAGDIAGATAELENLVTTAVPIFQASGLEDQLLLERYLLGLLYTSAGDDDAADSAWKAMTSVQLLYEVPEQAATFKAWEELQAQCNNASVDTAPTWGTATEPCLPQALDERIMFVYDLFLARLPFRIHYEPLAYLGGLACPFVFTYDRTRQSWTRDNTILYRLVGTESERIQYRPLDSFDGRLLIRELEPEVSYLDQVYILAVDDKGRETILHHSFTPLQEADESYLVLHQGDERLLTFAGYDTLVGRQHFWVVAKGYYVPLWHNPAAEK